MNDVTVPKRWTPGATLWFLWMIGMAVWTSSWSGSLRVLLVLSFTLGWTLVSIPRAGKQGES